MNQYTGKTCPYCKTPIVEDDDVVVCSVCEMPHHKDCWVENQGCTTFGCLGTITAPQNDRPRPTSAQNYETIQFGGQAPAQQSVFCHRCGAKNPQESQFCVNCGTAIRRPAPAQPVQPQYAPPNPYAQTAQPYGAAAPVAESDLALLVGTNSEYYIPAFNNMRMQGQKIGWNWSAFLIAPYWMLYRKMYAYGAGLLAGVLALSFIPGWFGYLLMLAAYAAVGIFGNYIYMDTIYKKAARLRMLPGEQRSAYIAKEGDTNITAAVLTAVGYALAVAVIMFL